MTKQEVLADAQRYADIAQRVVYVQSRGSNWTASVIHKPGWKLIQVVRPEPATDEVTP